MKTITRALENYRQYERDYIAELDSIRREIEFLLAFIAESPSHRSLAPAVEDLRVREMQIEKALQESTLLPVPDELRNPFTRVSPEKTAYIEQLMQKHGMRRSRLAPAE